MITVSTIELIQAIEFIKKCVCTDDHRPILNGIHMKQKDDKLVVESVDGFRLAREIIQISESYGDKPFECIVKPFFIDKENAKSFASGMCELETDGVFLTFTDLLTREWHTHKVIRGEFIGTDGVLNVGDPSFSIVINKTYLSEALLRFKGKNCAVTLEFHGDMGPVIIRQGNDSQRLCLILPLRR